MAALVATVLLSQPVLAQSQPQENDVSRTFEQVTRTIDISGMDISSSTGARRLYREIVSTAKSICWGSRRTEKGVLRAKHRREHGMRCFDAAVTDALAQVTDRAGVDLEQVAGLDRFDEAGLVASR